MPFALAGVGLACVAFGLLARGGGELDEEPREGRGDVPPKLDRSTRRRAEKQVRDLVRKGKLREAADLALHRQPARSRGGAVPPGGGCPARRGDEARPESLRRSRGALHPGGRITSRPRPSSRSARSDQAAEAFERAGRRAWRPRCGRRPASTRRPPSASQEPPASRATRPRPGCAPELAQGRRLPRGGDRRGGLEGQQRRSQEGEGGPHPASCSAASCGAGGELEKAAAMLERGGCHAASAELRCAWSPRQGGRACTRDRRRAARGRGARAPGREEGGRPAPGEYHRDRGEDEEAAAAFETAGDSLSAGDLCRKLAGASTRRRGLRADPRPFAQAARRCTVGRATRCGPPRCDEAAPAVRRGAELLGRERGDRRKQAELLARAGPAPRGGASCCHARGLGDEAIKVLQRVEPQTRTTHEPRPCSAAIFQRQGHALPLDQEAASGPRQRGAQAQNIAAFFALRGRVRRQPPVRASASSWTRRSSPATTTTPTWRRASTRAARSCGCRAARTSPPAGERRAAAPSASTGSARYQITSPSSAAAGWASSTRPRTRSSTGSWPYKVLPDSLQGEPAGSQELPARGQERRTAQPPQHRHGVRRGRAGRPATTSRWSTSTARR